MTLDELGRDSDPAPDFDPASPDLLDWFLRIAAAGSVESFAGPERPNLRELRTFLALECLLRPAAFAAPLREAGMSSDEIENMGKNSPPLAQALAAVACLLRWKIGGRRYRVGRESPWVRRQRVLLAKRSNPRASVGDLVRLTGVSRATVYRILKRSAR